MTYLMMPLIARGVSVTFVIPIRGSRAMFNRRTRRLENEMDAILKRIKKERERAYQLHKKIQEQLKMLEEMNNGLKGIE